MDIKNLSNKKGEEKWKLNFGSGITWETRWFTPTRN
jgi:hypothetical protein